MPVPHISVWFTPGTGQPGIELAPILSQETNAMLTTIIEDPTGTNNFTTGDVSLKGYDVPNGTTVRNYFSAMTPLSTDYTVLINLAIIPPGGTTYVGDVTFEGYIAPNTVQFEPRTGAFSFTVIGKARNLQTTSAAGLFQRTGYFDGKWQLYSDASKLNGATMAIQVASMLPAQTNPDFLTNDQIQLATNETFTIINVLPDPATNPPAFWTLQLSAPLTKDYATLTPVHLLTPYLRNQALVDVVTALFAAAGFPNKQYFFSAALPNSSQLFTSPMILTGLPDRYGVGIAPAAETGGTKIAVSSSSGAYLAADATNGFTFLVGSSGYQQPPVDATNYWTTKTMFGYKRQTTQAGNPRFGSNITMKFYAYDHLAGNKRYILTVTCNADVAPGTPFSVTTALASETDSGGWVWGSNTPIGGIGISTTTSTDLSTLYDAIGIDVDPASGTVFFTDIQLTGAAGSPITMNTSSYQPAGAGYVAARVSAKNGPIVMTGPGRCVVFQTDGILGLDPGSYTYTLTAPGTMTLVGHGVGMSPYIVGRSLKYNTGDGRFYALIGDPTQGVQIISWPTDSLSNAQKLVSKIADPTWVPTKSTGLGVRPYEIDLCVQYGVSAGVGNPCPMFGLFGGIPVFISRTGSGVIPYADMTGLSVADALQQLSILVAGIFYLTSNGNWWVFRSRAAPMPGNTIGTNDQIDGDAGFINVITQSVYNLWTGYVSVENENDKTIFGDTSDIPGSIAYASANTTSGQATMSLELKTRFVTSSSFASALAHSLYNYLGAQKRWIEVNRFRDGRVYEIGRTFHCNVDGSNRQFQITETDLAVCGMTVKIVALEV